MLKIYTCLHPFLTQQQNNTNYLRNIQLRLWIQNSSHPIFCKKQEFTFLWALARFFKSFFLRQGKKFFFRWRVMKVRRPSAKKFPIINAKKISSNWINFLLPFVRLIILLLCVVASVTRLGNLLDFGQLFKAFGSN